MATSQALHDALRQLESELAEQLRQIEETRRKIHRIKADLADMDREAGATAPQLGPATSAEKVALFRSLFRGREDVYPRLWVSSKGDRKGYSPVCTNEGNRALCDKFRVKCADCPNRRFAQLDDRAVLDHLQGRHVIGVYPLLLDETCCLLAADFDGEGWREDATAVLETCRQQGIPAALERSRSGKVPICGSSSPRLFPRQWPESSGPSC